MLSPVAGTRRVDVEGRQHPADLAGRLRSSLDIGQGSGDLLYRRQEAVKGRESARGEGAIAFSLIGPYRALYRLSNITRCRARSRS